MLERILFLVARVRRGLELRTAYTGYQGMIENQKLTEHYTLYDLTRTDHADLLEANRHVTTDQVIKLIQVAELFETAWQLLNVPILISSGYRCPALNAAVGSSMRSQHLLCEAGDGVPKGMPVDEAFRILRARSKEGKIRFGQMIWEKQNRGYANGAVEWIHLSLGFPYRTSERCGQILTMVDGHYDLVETV